MMWGLLGIYELLPVRDYLEFYFSYAKPHCLQIQRLEL